MADLPDRTQGHARQDTQAGLAERWTEIAGGVVLAAAGYRRGGIRGAVMALAGGGLAWAGLSGVSVVRSARRIGVDLEGVQGRVTEWLPAADNSPSISVERSVTIQRPAADLYRFWRDLSHLPRLMEHLERVDVIDERRSHWVAWGPGEQPLEWDAEITRDELDRLISWRSVGKADVDSAGTVSFRPAPGGRGTEVRVEMTYSNPAGAVGRAVARLFGKEPDQMLREALRHFKQIMEAGEVPSVEAQPAGNRGWREIEG
ncbi:MAG TPA: SRPBCC family protein [Azospirillaceae bacterium]|nr:SRPBCC family protein [Azospirillaceae bacterium]